MSIASPSETLLDVVQIASPCSASWDGMQGDERSRFCNQCKLHVYNLSGMTREQAEQLVAEREGRLCVRFYRRPDGTVITRDCPVGLRALRRRIVRMSASIAALVMMLISGIVYGRGQAEKRKNAANNPPFIGPIATETNQGPTRQLESWIDTRQSTIIMMGAVCFPPTFPDPSIDPEVDSATLIIPE